MLLLAPEAQINYLFALIQREEAALDVGKRERTESKKVVGRGEREVETKKRKWKTDRAALFTQTPHLFLGKETGCTQMRSYSFFLTGEDMKSSVLFSPTAIIPWMSEAEMERL